MEREQVKRNGWDGYCLDCYHYKISVMPKDFRLESRMILPPNPDILLNMSFWPVTTQLMIMAFIQFRGCGINQGN